MEVERGKKKSRRKTIGDEEPLYKMRRRKSHLDWKIEKETGKQADGRQRKT